MLERSFITKENRLYGEQVVLAWLSGTFYITTHHPFILPTILSQPSLSSVTVQPTLKCLFSLFNPIKSCPRFYPTDFCVLASEISASSLNAPHYHYQNLNNCFISLNARIGILAQPRQYKSFLTDSFCRNYSVSCIITSRYPCVHPCHKKTRFHFLWEQQ